MVIGTLSIAGMVLTEMRATILELKGGIDPVEVGVTVVPFGVISNL
jgi:hypothetical protein